MSTSTVKTGVTFRSAYADSNALWRVERVSDGIAHCVIVNEPWEYNGRTYDGDYAGVRKPFYVSEVEDKLAWEESMRESQKRNEDFFDGLEPGQIVHYHNGFGDFVRCEVIVLDEDTRSGPSEYKAGTKVLQPIALVGKWKHDLPREYKDENGQTKVVIPYHAEKVLNRTGAWRPHQSCVFEAPEYASQYRRNQGDPTGMKPINLLANLSTATLNAAAGVKL